MLNDARLASRIVFTLPQALSRVSLFLFLLIGCAVVIVLLAVCDKKMRKTFFSCFRYRSTSLMMSRNASCRDVDGVRRLLRGGKLLLSQMISKKRKKAFALILWWWSENYTLYFFFLNILSSLTSGWGVTTMTTTTTKRKWQTRNYTYGCTLFIDAPHFSCKIVIL